MGLMQWYARRVAPTRWGARANAKIMPPIDRAVKRLTGSPLSARVIPTLMLTTTGRRSGEPRTSPLLYVEHDGGWAVVGTNFGQRHHPAWTWNLLAAPHGEVELDGLRWPVSARQVTDQEFDQLWPRFVAFYPGYESYRARLQREARMFHLRPAETGPE